MREDAEPSEIAAALRTSIGLLLRRMRQTTAEGELTVAEISALARLDRHGPASPSELAKLEQISPQSMGATMGALEERGLVERRPDPEDRRRVVMSLSPDGHAALRSHRDASTQQLAQALASGFTPGELKRLKEAAPLIERLAQGI